MHRRHPAITWTAAFLLLAGVLTNSVRAEIELFSDNPLFEAIKAQNVEEVSALAVRGEYLETRDAEIRTPIIYGALIGNLDIVEILIKARVQMDHRDRLGNSALYYVAGSGDLEIMEALLDAGAKPDIENRQGMTPLMSAAAKGAVDAVRLLLDRKADANRRDYTGRTALMWAEWNQRRAVVTLMRNAGIRE